jgi:L-asparaginase / beta-aspartyl-peptidase
LSRRWALVLHGGAGLKLSDPRKAKILNELKSIVTETSKSLENGGSSLDAVEQAVYRLEDSGLFNAGRGACLTSNGKVELEAGICRGGDLASGSVLRVTNNAHPVSIARFIMEKTNMVSMHAEDAIGLMRLYERVEKQNLVTEEKIVQWKKNMANIRLKDSVMRKFHPKTLKIILENPRYRRISMHGTVGAVAIDGEGELAAADSTGGNWLKMPGRIGDSGVFGAGFYANHYGAVTVTGVGEYAIRFLLSHAVAERMKSMTANKAVRHTLGEFERRFGKNSIGAIAVDRNYEIGIWHNTEGMGHAYLSNVLKKPVARLTVHRS